MPIYEYHCNDCNADFEQLVFSSSQADRVPCSKCGSTNVERKVSSVASAGASSASSAAAAYSSCGSSGFS
ncbi:MAG: zinc ribbon domain-containing protein [Acidobacteria bacterium]|nr:MAG: zinc ribbon domain-containing protein [Acidobacteriota bacterium]